MIKLLLSSALMLFLTSIGVSTANAQQAVGSHPVWITIGAGTATSTSVSGGSTNSESVSLDVSYSFGRGKRFYQLELNYISHFSLTPRYTAVAFNPGIGNRMAGTYHLLALFIGPSILYHTQTSHIAGGAPDQSRSIVLGLAGNAQVFVKPLGALLPEVGIGFGLFANLNYKQNHYGLRLSLLFSNTL